MLNYKIVNAKLKDVDILNSIKLVTMIDDLADESLSYEEKDKIKKSVSKNIELNSEKYKLIQIESKVAGAYLVLPYDDGYIIDEIYLFKEYRNQEIGSSIIKKIMNDYDNLYIWVYQNNKDALRLFKSLGFNTVVEGRTMILKYDKVYNTIKDKLESIKLGYRDKKDNKYTIYNQNFRDNFYLQSPKQLLESKIGCVFDQVELERELITKLDTDCRTYFISYPSDDADMAHAFLIYKDSKKYYWLENAWLKYKGIHIYNKKDELLNDVLKKYVASIPNGDYRKVRLYMFEKPRYGINYARYLNHCISNRSIKIK